MAKAVLNRSAYLKNLPIYIKLCALGLLIFCSINANAQNTTQQHYFIDSLPVEAALSELAKQANVEIVFSSNSIKDNSIVYINDVISFEEALKICIAKNAVDIQQKKGKYILSATRQNSVISGYIVDEINGEHLIAAHVRIGNSVVVTNEYGFFSANIPAGVSTIAISYIGFEPLVLPIENIKGNKRIQLSRANTLNEVVVSDEKKSAQHSTIDFKEEVNLNKFSNAVSSSLGGENDINQKLQFISGVQAHPDALSGWHVRGGGTEQNQIMVDGAQIYNPSHALGLISVFNSDAVRYQKLYKGNMPAEYGGFGSSTIELFTREGNSNHFEGKVGINALNAKVQFEGPIIKERLSFFVSGRKSIIDPFVKNISERIKERNNILGESRFSIYDVNAKLNFKVNNNHRLYWSFYKGHDKIEDIAVIKYQDLFNQYFDVDDGVYQWGNMVGSFRWNHILSNKVFGNFSVTYSEFKYDNKVLNVDESIVQDNAERVGYLTQLSTNIQDLTFRWDVDILHNKNHRIETGLQATYRHFAPGIFLDELDVGALSEEDFEDPFDLDSLFDISDGSDFRNQDVYHSWETALYLKDRIQLHEQIHLNIGMRLNLLTTFNKAYFNPEPRLQLNIATKNQHWQWRSSFSKTTQYSHLLSPSESGLPSDLWVPVTQTIKPQHIWLVSSGLVFQHENLFNFEIDGYYKRMYNQLLYNPFEFWSINESINNETVEIWEEDVIVGDGWAAGAEFTIERSTKKYNLYASYTLAWSQRQYEEINQGEYFPYRFDRRHDFAASFTYKINPKISVYASWFYGTGYPITYSVNRFSLLSPIAHIIDDYNPNRSINSDRLKSYHRLDAGINFKWTKPKIRHTLQLGVYNLYNRRNAVSGYLELNPDQPTESTPRTVSLMGALPTLSYTLHFGKKK